MSNIDKVEKAAAKFNTIQNARRFKYRAQRGFVIVEGRDGLFWVVTPGEGIRCNRAGMAITK